ncbi:YraN family protein [Agrobacterium sp. DKPNP3]|uniref:YraN family protein n=1 Tax=Agrobacterium sp. DKPNP3 TaxID=3457323 RepID=UPI00404503D8
MDAEGPSSRRRKAERRGHVAEYWAAFYLLLKGYRILAIRYRTRLGEIDLIARKKDIIAVIEVKARPSGMGAVDAVGVQSQQRIRAAADLWLARRKDAERLSLRFDIIAIMPRRLPQHFIDAF